MTTDQVNPESTDVTTDLYKAAIGVRNQDYYLRYFARFDAAGKTGVTWNWSACLASLNWLVFRKMWGLALWYVSLAITFALLIFGIGKLVFNYSEMTEMGLGVLFVLMIFVPPGLYANAAFYRFCEKRITKALVSDAGVQGACELLAKDASSSRRWYVLAVLNGVFWALLVGLLWLAPGLKVFEKMQMASSDASIPVESKPPVPVPRQLSADLPASAPAVIASTSELVAVAPAVPAASSSAPVPIAGIAEQVIASAKPAVIEEVAQPAVTLKPEPVSDTQEKPRVKTDKPVKVNKVEVAEVAGKPAQHYFIQVGAFADEGNARKVTEKLEAIGLSPVVQVIDGANGRLTQVRVGPFALRSEARKAAAKIEALGLPALFVKV